MDSFLESAEGLLYTVNGFDPMLRWDGQTAQAELAGLAAPTQAPTLAASGTGSIVGTYTAYVRFVDRLGNVSNLSPISSSLDAFAAGSSGAVTAATSNTPIQITTSAAHGLVTGGIVKVANVGGNTNANGTWTVTVIDDTDFTLDGSLGGATYNGGGTWQAGAGTITYGNVQITHDPAVVGRQILRNTDGEAITYYVDVDTTDLLSQTFTSTKTDVQLATGDSQAILGSDGLPLANVHYVPPTHKTSLAAQLDRLFLAGQYDEARGSVIVTNGSTTVTGVGTDWVAGLAGRQLYLVGANNSYQIASVDTIGQTLTLATTYQDASDKFAVYAIRPQPAERRLVYYTPANQPESWPPTYALQIQEDDDEIVCPMARGSFLYILERRHIYKITFQSDPAVDGAIFLTANRGCINNACWQIVDGDAYMLDEYGIHKLSQNGQVEHLSENIQELFRPGSLYKYSVNWAASRYFFSVVSRPQSIIRWFICLEGDYIPHHALCYNMRLGRWWLERYPFGVGAGCAGHVNGVPYTFLCGDNAKVYAVSNTAVTDITDPGLGTIRGTVTTPSICGLTDSAAVFCTTGVGSVINAPVTIIDRTGKGQTRQVVAATATTLTVDKPWTVSLDTTSAYQVGGVTWNWKATWLRLAPTDVMADRAIEILFDPTDHPCTMDFRTRADFGLPDVQKLSVTSAQGGGVRTDNGQPDKVIDLTKQLGVVLIRLPAHKERFVDGRRYLQMELAGTTNLDQLAVYELIAEGMGNIATVAQQQ